MADLIDAYIAGRPKSRVADDLAAALRAVIDLHTPNGSFCEECGAVRPCDTIRAVITALEAPRVPPEGPSPLPDSETERPSRCPALTPGGDLITEGRQCQQYEGHAHDHTWYGDNGHAYSAWRVTS